MEKIWLDTDIGTDIDDALCLTYLLSRPDCDLLGVSTVTGEVEKRAMMVSAMTTHAGRGDVPVYAGAESPLIIAQKQCLAPQAEALGAWPRQNVFPRGEALMAMREAVRSNPGAVTLLGIGPLTNIALLFAMDPEIPAMLKRLVVMCGVFTYGLKAYTCLSEWNARCDPHASAMVYAAPVTEVFSVGLDVTTQVTMDAGEVRARLAGIPVAAPVLDFLAARPDHYGPITFHDPLAAAVVFEPGLCQFRRGDIEIELSSQRLEGLTYFTADESGNDYAAFGVDAEEFFAHYFGALKCANH